MANLFDMAEKMGLEKEKKISNNIESKKNNPEKRRPWLEPDLEPIKKGELKKPEAKLIQIDKKLEKIQTQTEKLLRKHEDKLTIKDTQTKHKPTIIHAQTMHKSKRDASYFTYICLPPRKLPRKILDHVKKNAFIENNEWYSKIDSYELSKEADIKSHQISNTVRQLRDEGFYEIIESSSSGYRLLKINPEIFGIKQA